MNTAISLCETHKYWQTYFKDKESGKYCPDCGLPLKENKPHFQIYSPDGHPLFNDPGYLTKADCYRVFELWIKRFEKQGYYLLSNGHKLQLEDVIYLCHIESLEIENNE